LRARALAQVAATLTDGEAVEICHAAADRGFPRERLPAPTSEVLDWLVEEDIFLYATEPFFIEHDKDFDDGYMSAYAATALAALHRELTVEAVRALAARNTAPTPYDPFGDLAKIISQVRRMPGPFTADLADAIARLKEAGAWGTPSVIETRLRSLAAGSL
jgi:hypothetical protein